MEIVCLEFDELIGDILWAMLTLNIVDMYRSIDDHCESGDGVVIISNIFNI